MSTTRRATAGAPSASGLAYSVDGQGLVRDVRERTAPVVATHPTAKPPASLGHLLSPLAWEPLQRLLSWGAREGMTVAEMLDACRVGARHDGRQTTHKRRSTWR